MADATGTVHQEFGGKTYELRLTMRSIAALQEKYGNSVAGLLDGTAGEIPNFGALLDLVSLALQRGSKIDSADADDLADEMMSEDTEIVGRIITAAFPDAGGDVGNATGPKAAA